MQQLYIRKGVFPEPKMLKSAKAKVDQQLASDSHQLQEKEMYKICAVMCIQVYGAERVTTTRQRQFQVRLNRAQPVANIWSDADC